MISKTTTVGRIAIAAAAVLVVAAGIGLSSACQPQRATLAPTKPSPPPTSSSTTPDEAIKAAYNQYWTYLHGLDKKPVSTWRDQLGRVAAEPQLSATLKAMRYQRDIGESAYGHVTARVEKVDVTGSEARLIDCQDASKSGLQDTKSGRKKNRGIARNPVRADLHRGDSDGRWRVVQISYPGGKC